MKYSSQSRTVFIALLVVGTTSMSSRPADAQAWIGQVVGQMAASQHEAELEKQCVAGKPVTPEDLERADRRIERSLDDYFALTQSSKPREIRSVFTTDRENPSWKDADQAVAIDQLAPRLTVRPVERKRIALVVGGDNQTGRAIWSVTEVEGEPPSFYAGDFVNEGWLSGWRIWHLARFSASSPPETPAAYCHFDPEQSF